MVKAQLSLSTSQLVSAEFSAQAVPVPSSAPVQLAAMVVAVPEQVAATVVASPRQMGSAGDATAAQTASSWSFWHVTARVRVLCGESQVMGQSG